MERGFLSSSRKGGTHKKIVTNIADLDFVNEQLDSSITWLKNLVLNVEDINTLNVTHGIDVVSGINGDGKLDDVSANTNLHDDSSNPGFVLVIVHESPTTDNSTLILSEPTSYEDGLDAMQENEDVASVPVWVKFYGVHMTAFSEDDLSIIAPKIGTLLMLESYTSDMCMQSWGRSSYARAIIYQRANEELKDSIMVFEHVLNDCPEKIVLDVVNNLNNPRQATRGVQLIQRQEVKNSNPFDALNSIQKDDDLGTNGGISKSDEKGSLNVAHGSSSNTIIDKIEKLECQMLDGKLMFMDDDGNPLVPTSNMDNESEVEVVFDETANLMASTSFKGGSDKCYGTNSLLEHGGKQNGMMTTTRMMTICVKVMICMITFKLFVMI
ncbi:hypothetical protein Tco_0104652 [Tanacetum coccineum]